VTDLRLRDTDAIAEFIALEYKGVKKIVEVMVGYNPWVAQAIKERLPDVEVVVVDRFQEKVYYISQRSPELKSVKDDILHPNIEVYKGSSLIYTIRPPEECLPYIYNLASQIGADVLVRPLADVDGAFYYPAKDGWELKSYKQSSFWWLKRVKNTK
jgi:uncharacterized UPF0146 family protein